MDEQELLLEKGRIEEEIITLLERSIYIKNIDLVWQKKYDKLQEKNDEIMRKISILEINEAWLRVWQKSVEKNIAEQLKEYSKKNRGHQNALDYVFFMRDNILIEISTLQQEIQLAYLDIIEKEIMVSWRKEKIANFFKKRKNKKENG